MWQGPEPRKVAPGLVGDDQTPSDRRCVFRQIEWNDIACGRVSRIGIGVGAKRGAEVDAETVFDL